MTKITQNQITSINTQEKITKKVYRATSGNSYILIQTTDTHHHIFFPFTQIRGEQGTIPITTALGEYLGEVEIVDLSPVFEELMKITQGH